jgi:hypothetical protein
MTSGGRVCTIISFHDDIVVAMTSDAVYAKLLALRTGLRRFERWSEQQAPDTGLTPAQHQLLLPSAATLIRPGRPLARSPLTCC